MNFSEIPIVISQLVRYQTNILSAVNASSNCCIYTDRLHY